MVIKMLLFLFCFVEPVQETPLEQANLSIEFQGIEQAAGQIEIRIFNAPKGFPAQSKAAFRILWIPVETSNPTVVIKDLPYGEYAISCFWDANNNQKLDKNLIGIPKEKVGTSNNPKTSGIPSFASGKFNIVSSNQGIRINMQ